MVLSEREQRALLETEALLRIDDDQFVRAFDGLAQYDRPVVAAPVPAPGAHGCELSAQSVRAGRRRGLPVYEQVLRIFFALGILVMLGVCGWVFQDGNGQLQLLAVVVMFPVIALLAFTVLVLSLREDR